MSLKPKSLQKKEEEIKEIDKISKESRFGFFSIPYNQVLGDGYYSSIKYNNHKVEGRKVITEKRGIYTTPGKTGKGHDAYFYSYDRADDNTQKRLEQGWIDDKMKMLDKIYLNKKNPFTAPFKYPGINERKDNYFHEPEGRKLPLYKEPEKKYVVINRKVYGERRGIFTQPMKNGLYNTPGICFSYIPFHEDHEFLKTFKTKRMSIYKKPKYLYVPPNKKKSKSYCKPKRGKSAKINMPKQNDIIKSGKNEKQK